MCGLMGVVSDRVLTKDQANFINEALEVGVLRGRHASGVISILDNGDQKCAKRALHGSDFIGSHELRQLVNFGRLPVSLIGHNRAATHGAVRKDDNAHPFQWGKVCGVHNGGVPMYLLDKLDTKKSHDVDSGRIFKLISEVDNPIEVLRELYEGAYSLIWHDARTNCLHLARNASRPLCLANTQSGLYMASEMGMLGWLLARGRILTGHKGRIEVAQTDVNTLYTIPIGKLNECTKTPYTHIAAPKKVNVHSQRKANHGNKKTTRKKEASGNVQNKHTHRSFRGVPAENGYGGKTRVEFYTLEALQEDFPTLKNQVDFINSVQTRAQEEIWFNVPFIAYGTFDEDGETVIAGAVCTESGETSERLNVLVTVRGSGDDNGWMDELENLIDGCISTDPGTDNVYPVLRMQCKSYSLLPTGDIIIDGKPSKLDYGDVDYMDDITEAEADWGIFACSPRYLNNVGTSSLNNMWNALKAESDAIKEEDIPF